MKVVKLDSIKKRKIGIEANNSARSHVELLKEAFRALDKLNKAKHC